MKIIVNEEQFKLLTEQQGIEDFTVRISETYPDSVYVLDFIVNFIRNSGCKSIRVQPLKYKAQGLSLVDGVVINVSAFEKPFSTFLYILFHEVAHQYQYTKYGIDKMYACYTGELPVEDAANWMLQTEKVADDFAVRKIREMQQLFDDEYEINEPEVKVYDEAPIEHFIELINIFTQEINKKGYQNKEEISEILFNFVKNN